MSDPFLLEFASARPAELAELLSNADLGELDTLIAGLPTEIAARLTARLPSWRLIELLAKQTPVVTAELISGAGHDDAVTLVAHLNENRYPDILAASKKGQHKKLSRLFEFPTLSLSALASPEFIRVDQSMLCSTLKADLAAYQKSPARPIFAVDAQGAYRGIVNLLALIACNDQVLTIGKVCEHIPPLSGEMTAATALESPDWLDYASLPVTDGKGRIIGAVTQRFLMKLMIEESPEASGLGFIIPEMAAGYLYFCSEVLKSLSARAAK